MINERFIIAANLNGTELLRSLAECGQAAFATRILSPLELARLALARSGVGLPGKIITSDGEVAQMIASLAGNGYFNEESYADAQAVAVSLSQLRRYIVSDEEATVRETLTNGSFKRKNAALLKIYEKYSSLLDEHKIFDGIALIRYAIACCKPIQADFFTLKEAKLAPLEQALLIALSGNTYTETNIPALFGEKIKPPRISGITNAYGDINEVEGIINDIFQSGAPLDTCIIASADTAKCSQLFYDIAQSYGLPVTFGCGVPILNANPAKLLSLINEWDTIGYNGGDSLRKMINSSAFDREELKKRIGDIPLMRVIDIAGNLRLSMDRTTNRRKLAQYKECCLAQASDDVILAADAAERLAGELEKGYVYLVQNYSYIRRGNTHQGKLDRSAVKVIGDALRTFTSFAMEEEIPKLIPVLLNKTVSSENSREGFLHVTSILNAQSVLRQKLYICSLSAGNFPGIPREDPILLDDDYAYLSSKDLVSHEMLPLSENLVERKKQALYDLVDIYSALNRGIALSYSGFDVCELKDENPSASLFELYSKMNGSGTFEDYMTSVKQTGYFEKPLSLEHGIGKAYISGESFESSALKHDAGTYGCTLDRPFSPSAIETFFDCPCKFYLQYVIGLKQAEEDDPLVWLDALAKGNLAHTIMEYSANKNLSHEEFMDHTIKTLDEYQAKRPPAVDNTREREQFASMMEKAYFSDPNNTVILAEKELTVKHSSGVILSGKPDRLEKAPSGEYIVVDYKTGASVKHTENDCKSCIQTLLYAYMLENTEGISVSRCEYRYLRFSRSIFCEYSDSIKRNVDAMLKMFAASLPNVSTMYSEKLRDCDYCPFASLCGR